MAYNLLQKDEIGKLSHRIRRRHKSAEEIIQKGTIHESQEGEGIRNVWSEIRVDCYYQVTKVTYCFVSDGNL